MCRTDPKNKYVCITCRIGKHTTHRKDTEGALTQTEALNYQKEAWAEGGTACCGLFCRLGINTPGAPPPRIVRAFVTDLQQVKCALRLSGFFYGNPGGGIAGRTLRIRRMACLLSSCADCQHTKSIRACKCGSQRGQMLNEYECVTQQIVSKKKKETRKEKSKKVMG